MYCSMLGDVLLAAMAIASAAHRCARGVNSIYSSSSSSTIATIAVLSYHTFPSYHHHPGTVHVILSITLVETAMEHVASFLSDTAGEHLQHAP